MNWATHRSNDGVHRSMCSEYPSAKLTSFLPPRNRSRSSSSFRGISVMVDIDRFVGPTRLDAMSLPDAKGGRYPDSPLTEMIVH